MQAEPVHFPKTRQGVRDLDQMPGSYLPVSGGAIPANQFPNIGESERAISLLAGGALIGACLSSPSLLSLFGGIAGAALVYRGATGQCEVNRLLGRSTADPATLPDEMAYPVAGFQRE